ncbi:MAG: hypothetical protein KatS3mg124_0148 [Porticoccaceae bacterium]|nr:MAG: hypothetical protein KatS3mg124_0148 [Porticoccaceae bacterium]
MSESFADKTALVVGAAAGIGRAVAFELAARGARVALADRDLPTARSAAEELAAAGRRAIGTFCDVERPETLEAALATVEAELGHVDLLVNNVGAILSGRPEEIPLEEWRRIFELNFFYAVRTVQTLLPGMLERGAGHIVNVASVAGLFPYAINRAPYAAAKAALISYSENLALYTEPQGVRVTVFCPGPTRTAVAAGMMVWSKDAPMVGPGRQFALMSAEEVARRLVDAVAAGAVLAVAHDCAWEELRAHAVDPDGYLRRRLAAMAAGDLGLPPRPERES